MWKECQKTADGLFSVWTKDGSDALFIFSGTTPPVCDESDAWATVAGRWAEEVTKSFINHYDRRMSGNTLGPDLPWTEDFGSKE